MRFVHKTDDGWDINWMWMPSFLGLSTSLTAQIRESLRQKFEGRTMTDRLVEEMHQKCIDVICEKFPNTRGLREYLMAIREVKED